MKLLNKLRLIYTKWSPTTKIKIFFSVLGVIVTIIGLFYGGRYIFNNQNANFFGPTFQGDFRDAEFNFQGEPKIPLSKNFYYKLHIGTIGGYKNKSILELRPKQGAWYPFYFGILQNEVSTLNCTLEFAPSGRIPRSSKGFEKTSKDSDDTWLIKIGEEKATTDNSFFITCDSLPTLLRFGQAESKANYCLSLNKDGSWDKCLL